MDEYTKTNLKNWNERTPVHINSKRYNVKGFKKGYSTLKSIELEELGSVKGKSLLHLQCHFGLDSLSFARLGAKVTGVDFSDKAIIYARSLNKEVGLDARFIQSEIFKLPNVLKSKFDIVFASYGVFCWISNIEKWVKIVASFLEKGGILYIIDDHPILCIFKDKKLEYSSSNSYFNSGKPVKNKPNGTYVDRKARIVSPTYEWSHSVSDFLNAFIKAGLRIEYLHEFPFTVWNRFEGLMESKGKFYVMKDKNVKIPLLFSIKAKKS